MPEGGDHYVRPAMIVSTGSKLVAIDPGNAPQALRGVEGRGGGGAQQRGQTAGIDAKDIDIVIISH